MQIVAALRASPAGTEPTRSGYHNRVGPFKWLENARANTLAGMAMPTREHRRRVSAEPSGQF